MHGLIVEREQKKYLFSVRVTYTGVDSDKKYWYSSDLVYAIHPHPYTELAIKGMNGIERIPYRREYGVSLVRLKSDYDGDHNREMKKALSLEDVREILKPN